MEDPARSSTEVGPLPGGTDYERRIVSILFADLVGFTSLAERLDAEDVAAIQDRYFAAVRETVARYGGVIEKFIGDAAMAAFGVPRTRDDDAERAVRAGLAIVNAVDGLAAPLGLERGSLAVRVGVTTGEVVHAAGGPDAGRLSGDAVNTAARLQAAAPTGRVLIGETTALSVAEAIELEAHEPVALKGKAEETRVSLAVGARPVRSREAAMGVLRASTIGREEEMATLSAALDRVRSGSNETWLVVAPPGVGKSRLLGDFAARVVAPSAGPAPSIATARFRSGDGRPFEALADLAAAVVGDRTAATVEADLGRAGLRAGRSRVVARRLLDLTRSGGTPVAAREREGSDISAGTEGADRDALFDAWLAGLGALAGSTTSVWLIEDLHWAGPDVLAFLGRAQETTTSAGRLVVATARPSILEADPTWGVGDPDGRHRLDLPALAPTSTGDLVRALVGDALPVDLVERIAAASDGNPLFVEELLRSWVSVGLLARTTDRWSLTAAAPDVPVAVTVQAIYAAQLDDLPPVARQLARQGSVAGRRVPGDFLATIGATETDLGMSSLLRRALLAGPAADPPLGESYAYRHALLRDAGYASLARAERSTLHVAFARWVEEFLADEGDVAAEWVGEHLEAALREAPALVSLIGPDLPRAAASALAAGWLERGAEAATRHLARDRATELFRRALDLTPPADAASAARRERRLGESIATTGRLKEAVDHLELALDRYRTCFNDPGGTDADRVTARIGLAGTADSLARILIEQVRFEAAWLVAEAAVAEIGSADDPAVARLRLRAALARSDFTDRPEDLNPAAAAAVATARRDGDLELELDARFALLTGGSLADTLEEEGAAVAELARRLGRPEVLSLVLRIRAMAVAETSADPYPLLDEAAEVAVSYGLEEAFGWSDYARADIALARGEWEIASEAGLRAVEIGERYGYDRLIVRTWHVLIPIAAARADRDLLERGATWYDAAETFLPELPYGLLQSAGIHEVLGRLGIRPPRTPDPARLLASFDLEVGWPSWFEALDETLRRWLADGRLDAAAEQVRRLAVAQARWPSPLQDGAVKLFTARLALSRGDRASAVFSARAALRPFADVQARWWIARTIRFLERAGDASEMERAEALAIERELGVVGSAI